MNSIISKEFFKGSSQLTLAEFTNDSDARDWEVVNDGVMGGLSSGKFEISPAGHGLYYGKVLLENNGGFSLVRCQFSPLSVKDYDKVVIRLKGDGKQYQFRVKSNKIDRHCYIRNFITSGDWQIVEIPLKGMNARFRGNNLDLPDYPAQVMEEIAFLVGNKKAESFRLEIDQIILKGPVPFHLN